MPLPVSVSLCLGETFFPWSLPTCFHINLSLTLTFGVSRAPTRSPPRFAPSLFRIVSLFALFFSRFFFYFRLSSRSVRLISPPIFTPALTSLVTPSPLPLLLFLPSTVFRIMADVWPWNPSSKQDAVQRIKWRKTLKAYEFVLQLLSATYNFIILTTTIKICRIYDKSATRQWNYDVKVIIFTIYNHAVACERPHRSIRILAF